MLYNDEEGTHTHDGRSYSRIQASLSARLPRSVTQVMPLKVLSLDVHTLNVCLEYSGLPLRLSASYNARETTTRLNCGSLFSLFSHEMTSAKLNSSLNPTSRVCCAQKLQTTMVETSDNLENKQIQTKTDDSVNTAKEGPRHRHHKAGEHFSGDNEFSVASQKYPPKSGVHPVYLDKRKCGFSFEPSIQLKIASKTQHETNIVHTMEVLSCPSNARSDTKYAGQSGQIIDVDFKNNDNTCGETDERSNRNNWNVEGCQNMKNKSNGSSKKLNVNSDENSQNNNNSNDHHLDSDGSSDSEIDCTCNENDDSCKIFGPGIFNAVPATDHHAVAENLQDQLRDSVDEYFQQIALDNSRHSTQTQMEHSTETSNIIARETVTLSNDEKISKAMTLNSMSVTDAPHTVVSSSEKLVDFSCENDQEFHTQNLNDSFFSFGHAGVQAPRELDTQNSPEAESLHPSQGTKMRRVDSSTEVLQTTEESSLTQDSHLLPEASQYSENQNGYEDTAARNELCLSVDFDDDYKLMSAAGKEHFPSSQEDFTENNGTLQASCTDKTIVYEGLKSTEITNDPVRILRGFCDESEILKCWENSVHTRQTGQACLEDVKCVNFLSVLTKRLKEYANTEVSVTPAGENETSQADYVKSDEALVFSVSHTANHESISLCESTSKDSYISPTHTPRYEQQGECVDAMTVLTPHEASVDCALAQHHNIDITSEKQAHLSSKQIVYANVPEENMQITLTQEISPGSTEDIPLQTPPSHEQADASGLYELWSTKYTMSVSDQFLQKYDLLTMQSKEKYKKSPDPLKSGITDLRRNANYEFADPAFEVDVFRSLEYATSLSCGLVSEKRCYGPVTYDQTNSSGEFHDLAVTHPKDNSRKNSGFTHELEAVTTKAGAGQKTSSVSTCHENICSQNSEEDAASYSRARIMRASERRRKLMTEFEEITSCADVYNWPRYDNRNFCYESRSFGQDFESSLKRQVTGLDSTAQCEETHMTGTFTIEYLKPPVSGFIYLK